VTSTERLIDHLYKKGVGGLYVTGSTGEGIYLDFDIRKQIVEVAARLSRGRGTVIVHVGAIQAAKALELADHAGKVTSWRVKIFDALAQKCVRSSHHTEASLLETAVE